MARFAEEGWDLDYHPRRRRRVDPGHIAVERPTRLAEGDPPFGLQVYLLKSYAGYGGMRYVRLPKCLIGYVPLRREWSEEEIQAWQSDRTCLVYFRGDLVTVPRDHLALG
jgi:hypothetical protein